MRFFHSTCPVFGLAVVCALASVAPRLGAQQGGRAGEAASSDFSIYIRGVAIGNEQISVSRTAEGWTIASSGRLAAPLNVVTRRLQLRYDSNWKAIELTIDADIRGQAFSLKSAVGTGTVTNEVVNGTETSTSTAMVNADVLLPTPFFAAYEALAARLKSAPRGSTIAGYAPPQTAVTIQVGESVVEHIQTASQLIETRRTHLTLNAPNAAPLDFDLWADANGRLLRLSVPPQGLEVARDDIASVSARTVPILRPNDEQVRIPSNGFTLAGTVSRPTQPAGPRPAVVFIGTSGSVDRDEYVYGIPILGQLAGAVADAGFIALRFDKRGVGQSGGRAESGTLNDLAEDLRSAVKLLAERKDVDPKRIAVVGHSDGGSIALIAASKDKRVAAVGLLATNGVSGASLVLEQQQHALNRSALSDTEKQSRVELQKQINQAVLTGAGWDKLPPEVRRLSDNLEYQSILMMDPAKVVPKVRQPILAIQGELDTEVAPINGERLEALARQRKNAGPVTLVRLPGVNHLLVNATTGETDEYALLKEKTVSATVSNALISWLQKTLPK